MSKPAGTPRTRALAVALRQLITGSGIPVRELGKRVGVSHGTISLWSNGKLVPKPHQVDALMKALDVPEVARCRIRELTEHARDQDWLTSGQPGVTEQLAVVLECERTAEQAIDWAPDVVPGLLQTGDYARTILGRRGDVPNLDARVALRVGRRDVLARAENPLRLTAFLGEKAVRHCIGSPAVRNHQLRYLLTMAETETVTIRVVPLGHEWHPCRMGPFIIYEFDGNPPIVHLEHHRSGTFLYNNDDVEEYRALASSLHERAMSPEKSAAFIAKCVK
ncbi:transcriptional regulator with XRE-family HTH domain [Saccharothrix coeruleofusca]|uniref:helix-turn-helix domain-containing protein n=1 Tax=Saccharothrix coeruleofusca TaxID=33919 RepID=UPI001AE6A1F8|nr:helix-turn-helix transcriptional regulator [Saccharothrix coeruleofusca]MBP2338853.1 transcriptional regulator with XRE-family HTH domain [Saccharothrix coeruleofusca]